MKRYVLQGMLLLALMSSPVDAARRTMATGGRAPTSVSFRDARFAAAGACVAVCCCFAASCFDFSGDRQQCVGFKFDKDGVPIGDVDALVAAYIPADQREEVARILQAGSLELAQKPDLFGKAIPLEELAGRLSDEAFNTVMIMTQIETRCPLDWRLAKEAREARRAQTDESHRLANDNKKAAQRLEKCARGGR